MIPTDLYIAAILIPIAILLYYFIRLKVDKDVDNKKLENYLLLAVMTVISMAYYFIIGLIYLGGIYLY